MIDMITDVMYDPQYSHDIREGFRISGITASKSTINNMDIRTGGKQSFPDIDIVPEQIDFSLLPSSYTFQVLSPAHHRHQPHYQHQKCVDENTQLSSCSTYTLR